jgi:hypothetical protein
MTSRQMPWNSHLGEYELPQEGRVVGHLHIRGPRTRVALHADHPICHQTTYPCIYGHSYSGDHLTLLDCSRAGTSGRSVGVVVGAKHLDPNSACIQSIIFSTTDLETLFYDIRAFGTIHDSRGALARTLNELGRENETELGPYPTIAYFSGRNRIVEAEAPFGRFSVNHSLSYNFGGPGGVHLRNRMYVELEPEQAFTFASAISTLRDVGLFLSAAAGHQQGIRQVHVVLPASAGEAHSTLMRVHMRYGLGMGRQRKARMHFREMPLDPLNDSEEFRSVLGNWFARHDDWRIARYRYLSCLGDANFYDADRLTRAANMFDLLPDVAVPEARALPAELVAAKEESMKRFRSLPDSTERSSALSALGRLWKPYLLTKVLRRIDVIDSSLSQFLPELRWVAAVAVKSRNAFVHGRSKDFNIEAAEPFVPFLTDALEFIFGTSDLVEAGWKCGGWIERKFSGQHRFSRFLLNYRPQLNDLKRALAAPALLPTRDDR